jgi:hypothetical protein
MPPCPTYNANPAGRGAATAAPSSSTARASSTPPTSTVPRGPGDPQLHTHALIANATRGPGERWTRLYLPAIYDHAKTAGNLYEAQLRDEPGRAVGPAEVSRITLHGVPVPPRDRDHDPVGCGVARR